MAAQLTSMPIRWLLGCATHHRRWPASSWWGSICLSGRASRSRAACGASRPPLQQRGGVGTWATKELSRCGCACMTRPLCWCARTWRLGMRRAMSSAGTLMWQTSCGAVCLTTRMHRVSECAVLWGPAAGARHGKLGPEAGGLQEQLVCWHSVLHASTRRGCRRLAYHAGWKGCKWRWNTRLLLPLGCCVQASRTGSRSAAAAGTGAA